MKSHDLDRLVAQLLDQQAASAAYQRGVTLARQHPDGLAKRFAASAGYPPHTQEHRLFIEGFLDTQQDEAAAAEYG